MTQTRNRPRLALWSTAVLACLAGLICACAAVAQDTTSVNWAGQWETSWRDGGGRLVLTQEGDRVTGVYPLYDGRIEAKTQGRTLRGVWTQDGLSGNFELVQSQDGRTFAGRFDSTEWWTGIRSDESGMLFITDQSSPSAVMRSFLAAANAAVDGDFDALRVALRLVLPTEQQESADERFEQTREFFQVINQTTINLSDIPDEPDIDTVRTEFLQSGTEFSVNVDFVRKDGLWFINPAPMTSLVDQNNALREARAASLASSDTVVTALESPRATMRTFLLSFRFRPDGSGPVARSTLDLRGRPEVTRAFDAEVLAGYLKRVIDRADYVIWQEISDDPLSDETYVHFRHPDGDIAIAPVLGENGVKWQFTP